MTNTLPTISIQLDDYHATTALLYGSPKQVSVPTAKPGNPEAIKPGSHHKVAGRPRAITLYAALETGHRE